MNIQLYDDVFLHYDKPNYWEKNTASKPQQKRVEIDGWMVVNDSLINDFIFLWLFNKLKHFDYLYWRK